MTPEAIFTLVVVGLTVVALAREFLSPDILLFGALVVLVAGGVVELSEALRGFSNPALLTIASLYVVAAGVRETGLLESATRRILGRSEGGSRSLWRLGGTTAISSAFLNNTPVVAMAIPAVTDWARRRDISPSKLLMPLSYASILGGLCTLIGTSTNLVVDGMMRGHDLPGLGFFELAYVGVPAAIVGMVYLVSIAPRLLPDREAVEARKAQTKEYLAEMKLSAPSSLIGRTVEEAGLRHLPGLFLIRIERAEATVAPVGPAERLAEGDHLIFAGQVETIADLRRFRGLRPVTSDPSVDQEREWELHEAVIPPGSALIGTSVRDVNFRARFNAAVIAVHRRGARIEKRIGNIVLRPGDTLMLEAAPGFHRAYHDVTEFYLLSRLRPRPADRRNRLVAVLILGAVILAAALGLVSLPLAAVGGALAMLLVGGLAYGEARRAVDWTVLIVIGSALGIAAAMEASGAAELLATGVVGAGEALGPVGVLTAVFVATMLLTELVTNNAAAAIMFPVAISAALSQGLDPRPLVIGITIAASLSLSTPIGYQTNLMVYGPGGYRFTDFTRTGAPLQICLAALAIILIPMVWPLHG